MADYTVKVIIPFRSPDSDSLHATANLDVTMAWWWAFGLIPEVVSDDLYEDQPFNHFRACNLAVSRNHDTDVFVFASPNVLTPPEQIIYAVKRAERAPGMVMPFTDMRYLSDEMTAWVRDKFSDLDAAELARWVSRPADDPYSIFRVGDRDYRTTHAQGIMAGRIENLFVVSRRTLNRVGPFPESISGSIYGSSAVELALSYLSASTRTVSGPAVRLHVPESPVDSGLSKRAREMLWKVRKGVESNDRRGVRKILSSY